MKKRWLVLIVALIGLTAGQYYLVSAQSSMLDSKKQEYIKVNCSATQSTLSRLRQSDTLLRVNRGQLYESIQTQLIEAFNARVSSNRLDGNELKTVNKEYNSALDGFRTDYIKYEEQLSRAISMDCQKQPQNFYDAVLVARETRQRLHEDIVKINQLATKYLEAVNNLQASLPTNKNNGETTNGKQS